VDWDMEYLVGARHRQDKLSEFGSQLFQNNHERLCHFLGIRRILSIAPACLPLRSRQACLPAVSRQAPIITLSVTVTFNCHLFEIALFYLLYFFLK